MQVMKKTFAYIREKYTDVNGYLDYIGFGEKERAGLRKALTFKAMQLEVQKSPNSKPETQAKDGATPGRRTTAPEARDRSQARDIPTSPPSDESGSSAPWSPDSREKSTRELGRSLGVPIGGSRTRRRSRSRSGSDKDKEKSDGKESLVALMANPRAGVELLGSGLGLHLPFDDKQHRRSVSDDVNSREDVRDDGFLPSKNAITKSPLGNSTSTSASNSNSASPSSSSSPSPSSSPPDSSHSHLPDN